MAFNLGVNVVEVDGRAPAALAAAPTSVAGFLIRSQRGVPNLPVPLKGFGDYVSNFGGYVDNAFGPYVLRGFFENGGSEAYAVRVLGAGSTVSGANITDRAPAPVLTLRVEAGVRGRSDPGAWGDSLSVAVVDHPRANSPIPAQIVSTKAEPYDLSGATTLTLSVNGGTSFNVVFDPGDFANIANASAIEVARVINRKTSFVQAGVSPSQALVLASTVPGAASRLTASGAAAGALSLAADSDKALDTGATLAILKSVGGLLPGSAVRLETRGRIVGTAAAAAPPAGSGFRVTVSGSPSPVAITLSAADIGAGTPGEVAAAINRQASGFTAEVTFDGRIVLLTSRYGAGASMAATAPMSGTDARVALKLDTATPAGGTRDYRLIDMVSERYKLVSWTTPLAAAVPAFAARLQSVEFDLVVYRDAVEVERFESLSMQDTLDYYVEAVVNDPESGSGYITVSDKASASGAGRDAPAEKRDPTTGQLQTYPLAGGGDVAPAEADYIGDPAVRTGLYAFDPVTIQLLASPETATQGMVSAALDYCARRGDVMFVGSPPRGFDLEGAKNYASAFRGKNVYGALYAPWIQVVNAADPTGLSPRQVIPPAGHILGVYARTDETRGVWKAPAGDEAQLRGALGVEFDMTDGDLTSVVKDGGVNGIRFVPGAGIILDSSRTLSTDTRWLFIPVRRLFNFVKTSLRDGLRWVAQEPHSEELRRSVKYNVVTPFLLGLWRRGAFGTGEAADLFTVVCGPENNPPAEVNLGNFKIEVYFYPVKPAETIVIVVGQQESGATATEP
jgi:phage tail sheath protein FI